ncbi:MAG: peroxiredoxin [Spirochaetia bacterium]|nr:peroxiredoxin [Spirochaetia bacterium]
MADSLEGTALPQFTLESTEGKSISATDLRGSWTVLYFYPKDDTEGCTKEACSFTASMGMFQKLNARVYGISKDSVASHKKFIEKYGLKFPLLADPKGQLVRALGAGKNAKFLAALLGLPARDTFLIDPQGQIVKVWRDVDPEQTVSVAYEEIKKRT